MSKITEKKWLLKRIGATKTLEDLDPRERKQKCQRVITLSRVSSKRQQDGASLDAQDDIIYEYCSKNGLRIDQEFRYVESSTRGNRKKYNELLDYIKKSKERVVLIVQCVDRLHRLTRDKDILDGFCKQKKLIIHFVKEGRIIDDSVSGGELVWWEESVVNAHRYVAALSDNVKRSMDHLRKEGQWLGRAHIGYKNIRKNISEMSPEEKKICREYERKSVADVVLDEEKSPLVRRLFAECLKGEKSISRLAEYAEEIGLRGPGGKAMVTTTVHQILTNPFYCGYMRIKGQLIPHKHSTLISEEDFVLVQEILAGRNKIKTKRTKDSVPFALRGIVKCGCGSSLSPYSKKGHVYLKCTQPKPECTVKNIREDKLLDQIMQEVLDKISIPSDVIDSFKHMATQYIQGKASMSKSKIRELEKEQKELQTRADKLLDLRIDGEISKDVYENKNKQISERLEEIHLQLDEGKRLTEDWDHQVQLVLDSLRDVKGIFESSQPEDKNCILKSLVENCIFDGQKLQISLKKPLDNLIKPADHPIWLGRTDSNHDKENQNLLSYH